MNIYRNGEGYYDPTAGNAIASVMTEFRQKERKKRKNKTKHQKNVNPTSNDRKPRRRSEDAHS